MQKPCCDGELRIWRVEERDSVHCSLWSEPGSSGDLGVEKGEVRGVGPLVEAPGYEDNHAGEDQSLQRVSGAQGCFLVGMSLVVRLLSSLSMFVYVHVRVNELVSSQGRVGLEHPFYFVDRKYIGNLGKGEILNDAPAP